MKKLDYNQQEIWRQNSDILCQSPIMLQKNSSKMTYGDPINLNFETINSRQETISGDQFLASGSLNLFNKNWNLERFHFHEHSEHMIDNRYHDIELHFVFTHKNDILVVGILADVSPNAVPKFQKLYNNQIETFNLLNLFPKNSNYYNYIGSLTTPPFNKPVQWVVLDKFLSISTTDLHTIQKCFSNNFRLLQNINGREIKYVIHK